MRYLQTLMLLLTTALLSACQSGGHSSAPSATGQPSPASIQKIEADGDWLVLFHCDGSNYLLETAIETGAGTIQLVLAGQAEPMKMPMQGRSRSQAPAVPGALRGTYDDRINTFIVSDPSRRRGTTFKGVFESSERFAAKIEGPQWANCSLAIGVRKKHRDELEHLTAKADSKFGKMFKNSQLGSVYRRFTSGSRNPECSKDEARWMARLQELAGHSRELGRDHALLAAAMFRDENFEPYFDQPLWEMSRDEGTRIAADLQGTSGCKLIDQRDRAGWMVLNDLVATLKNSPPLTRDHVMITNAAAGVIQNWLHDSAAHLATLERIYAEDPDAGLSRIGAMEQAAGYMSALIWSTPAQDYQNQLMASKTALKKKSFFKSLEVRYTETVDTFDALDQLARFPSSHGSDFALLDPTEKAGVEGKIRNRINAGAIMAAEAFVARHDTEQRYEALGQWKSQFASMAGLLTSDNQAEMERMIGRQRHQIALSALSAYQQQYDQTLSQQPTPLAALSAAVEAEGRLRRVSPGLLALPQYRQFAQDRELRRRTELSNAVAQVQQRISQCDNKTELKRVRQTYLLPDDEQTTAGRAILSALGEREKVVAPFSGYPSEDYLNALYGGDFEGLRQMDEAFSAPYKRMMASTGLNGVFALMGKMAEYFSGSAVKSENFAKSLQMHIDNISLIVPMFAVYLIDYQDVYGQCVESNAKPFRITTTMQTVHKDSAGFETSRTTDAVYHEDYKVNRRFAHVFEEVGLTEPDSVLGNLVDMMFSKNGRINVRDITASTRAMMGNYGCDSAMIGRMEKNMLTYFDAYLEKRNRAARTMFGQ